jgi:hypothetical protein
VNAELPALEELGRRMQLAVATRSPRSRRRRWLPLISAAVTLVAAPATATVTGIFNPHGDVPADAARVLVPTDPAATATKLRAQGYRITWVLVEDASPGSPGPTISRQVPAPPPGTELLAVLGPDGSRDIDPATKRVLIEIAPSGSAILAGHR